MGREVVSGVNPVLEILRAGKRRVYRIWVLKSGKEEKFSHVCKLASERKVPIIYASRAEIFERSRIEKNQGIAAEVDEFQYSSLEDILTCAKRDPKGHFIVVLDGILDPQNLGSIIRTSCLIGAHGVVIPKDNSSSISPASTRASGGAVEHMMVARVVNIERTLRKFKEDGIWVIGCELGGDDLYSFDLSGPLAIVFGSEGRGMRRLVRERCDKILSIPISPRGGVNSLNVSAAAAIFLGEVARRRLAR